MLKTWSNFSNNKLYSAAFQCIFFLNSVAGRNKIGDVIRVDEEAAMMADDKLADFYLWSDDGFYMAPSRSYRKIDLSPKPVATKRSLFGKNCYLDQLAQHTRHDKAKNVHNVKRFN